MIRHGYKYEYDPTDAEPDIIHIYDLAGSEDSQAIIRAFPSWTEYPFETRSWHSLSQQLLELSVATHSN